MKNKIVLFLFLLVFVFSLGICDAHESHWKQLGKVRITTYCPECNCPQGYQSSSGKTLKYGHAACNWLPIGTIIDIEGDSFEITDTCGTDAIDIFVDTDYCKCNINEYKNVSILEK